MKKFFDRINELKKTDKGKNILKLSIDLIFLLFVIIFVIVGTNLNKNRHYNISKVESIENIESTHDEVTYLEKQEELKTGTYDFEYNISGSLNVNYKGKYNNGNVEGYKEDNDAIIKYSIESGTVYKINMDNKTPYNELYLGLDTNLFNYDYIFNIINSKSGVINTKDDTTTYKYDVENVKYTIIVDDKHIKEIIIQNDILTYDYKFDFNS